MHRKLDILAKTGFAVLRDYDGLGIAPVEWESLTYLDWKSGGDTNFAPLASASGEMDCRGFWDHGKADKDGMWTENRSVAPSLVKYVETIGGNYGRVRVTSSTRAARPRHCASCIATTTTGSTQRGPVRADHLLGVRPRGRPLGAHPAGEATGHHGQRARAGHQGTEPDQLVLQDP
ncbi:MAG TPA: hypothetical protein VIL16_19960 [Trebonia sp.]